MSRTARPGHVGKPSIKTELFISTQTEFNIINSAAGKDNAAKVFFYGDLDRIDVTSPSATPDITASGPTGDKVETGVPPQRFYRVVLLP